MAAVAQVSGAQEIRGTVRDSTSGTPISATVITVHDNAGRALGRHVTDAQGQYHLTLPDGATELRVIRIGYRPQAVKVTALGSDILLPRIPSLLESVTVRAQQACPRRRDRAAALGLWEQARAALLASVVTRDANPAFLRRYMYHRVPSEVRRTISQIVRVDSAMSSTSFTSVLSAREFLDRGFRTDSIGFQQYHAPDAEVMLDDAFASAYCMEIEGDKRNRALAGLFFQPATKKRGRVDIEGTLWIDTVTRSLHELRFRYIGQPDVPDRLGAGGRLLFSTMPTGAPAITEWELFTPTSYNRPLPMQPAGSSPAVSTRRLYLLGLNETGGRLSSARWKDTVWRAPLATISGRVFYTGPAVGGPEVRLIATDYRADVDSAGAFRIHNVVAGDYIVSVPHPELNRFGLELTRRQEITVLGDSTINVNVIAPTITDFIKAKCPDSDTTSNLLVVRVRDRNRQRVRGAKVVISVAENLTLLDSLGRGQTSQVVWRKSAEGETGSSDRFFYPEDGELGSGGLHFGCNIASQTRYRVDARRGSESDFAEFASMPLTRRIFFVDLVLRPD